MNIMRHTLHRKRISGLVWTASIAILVAVVVAIWPSMKDQAQALDLLFQNMGAFGEAFGMGRLNLSHFTDFYAMETANILGLGGTIYAATLGIGLLSDEEHGRTAGFLFSHPITRTRFVLEQAVTGLMLITALHLIVTGTAALTIQVIHESPDTADFLRFHLSVFLTSLQLFLLTFGLSGFKSSTSNGLGIGLTFLAYIMNLLVNMSDRLAFLRYLTPFAYSDPATVLPSNQIPPDVLLPQLAVCLCIAVVGGVIYRRRDLRE